MLTLGKLSPLRHVVVGAAVAAIGAATFAGFIGDDRSERYDSKLIVVAPTSTGDGLRITEIVDVDFGSHRRHGYQRVIPLDFGQPGEITAVSPDAPDDVNTDFVADGLRIRLGDPDEQISGQHRYVLQYTYPNTTLSSGELALDVIGTEETFETRHFEIVVTGLELAAATCNVGSEGAEGGCSLTDDGGAYRVSLDPLEPGDGVTIGGTVVGARAVPTIEAPPLPPRRDDNRVPLAAATTAIGALGGAGTYVFARRRGRNEVFAGGAADAAYGPGAQAGPVAPPDAVAGSGAPLPAPAPYATSPAAAVSERLPGTRLVADQQMDELATIEFVPPAGVEPWLGRAVLQETVDSSTVSAWFSGAVGHEHLGITKSDDASVELSPGARLDVAPDDVRSLLLPMFADDSSLVIGKYSKPFATTWAAVQARQRTIVAESGYWKGRLNAAAAFSAVGLWAVVIAAVFLFRAFSAGAATGVIRTPVGAIALAVIAPTLTAAASYATLLPRRTAAGSAVALRTEAFRRFLCASEGEHVEWAWKHGLLREYSAWAVALDAADAWERALVKSGVATAELSTGPLVMWHAAGAMHATHTAPSKSGSGGSFGGFSGGSVGGGGGGGSSGSW